jgi:hypothetical protein
MTAQLKILAAVIGVSLFLCIIELVRKRRLREEYAWVWLLTGLMIVVLSVWYDLLFFLGRFLGGILPSALLFFFGLLSLLLICLHQAIKISQLTDDIKRLSQELSIMRVSKGSSVDGQ